MSTDAVKVPIYYTPRPQQQEAWERRLSGKYDYYFKIDHRQFGKDTDDIQFSLFNAYQNPGTQTAYVGLDNKWIKRNIWDKYLEGRRHWDNYPKSVLEPKQTDQQVLFHNNPEGKAEALVQFIGLKESETLLGSSYDNFFISELSRYKRGTFNFIFPIWENKIAEGLPLLVNANFTPRGLSNVAADFLKAYTGKDDPSEWPGEHGRVYVEHIPASKSLKADGTRLYTDEHLEAIRQRVIREHGNDNIFRQEFLCDFLTVNAGLVYPAIEYLRKDKRDAPVNINKAYPVYMSWDISSKGKESDWTSCVVFQYYNGKMFYLDYFEDNRKAVVECVQELSKRDYFHLIRAASLPWDSDRSGSKDSPLVECMKMFPSITWHKLERTYVIDGINRVRLQFPNLYINGPTCEWLIECFESWEYKELTMANDYAAEPKHDRFSHLMDAVRYSVDFCNQVEYIKTSSGQPAKMVSHYRGWQEGEEEESEWADMPVGMRPSKFSNMRNKKPSDYWEQSDTGLWVPKRS